MTGDEPNPQEEGILSPSELDITDSEYVDEIEEGRYVVSTDTTSPDIQPSRSPEDGGTSLPDTASSRYGVEIEARIENRSSTYRTQSDDVVTVFSELVRWYATQVDLELPPGRVLQILVAESDLPIGPRRSIETALDRHDLSPDDSIADLCSALETRN
ncbi:DUF7500 family protein [Halalkalicoccus subterraneus]|uniref:DUF7500 family protein n=1 Tax=Halalkalicoccus subterraneus TaxID=2675002 RepID=UPI000EFBC4D6|nr:hypothetical protein [Halalkalicoccus subterraneus]